jgi:hypothetical protein
MTIYEYLILQKEIFESGAAQISDNALRTYFAHAAEGRESKAKNLTLSEAAKCAIYAT